MVFKKTSGISGNLSSVGSDTLANLMTFWAEDFKKQYPNVNVQIQAAGSSTAPPALTQGTANLGPMSRTMKDNEIQDFEKKYGYKPTAIPVAVDALAVFVHKDNPIKGLSMPMVDAIFSSTRKCGYEKTANTWGDTGLTGAWASRTLQLFGRNSVSGTYGYFKEHALCKGDFKSNVNEQPGSASVVQSISNSINGIGYSGIGYVTSGVKAVPIGEPNASPRIWVCGSWPQPCSTDVHTSCAIGTASQCGKNGVWIPTVTSSSLRSHCDAHVLYRTPESNATKPNARRATRPK